MSFSQLDDYEKDLLQQEMLKDIRVRRLSFPDEANEEVFDQVYFDVLAEWGVMCVHPTHALQAIAGTIGFNCQICDCSVIDPSALSHLREIQRFHS